MNSIYIVSVASYTPNLLVDNYEQARQFGETPQFIDSKIGVRSLPRMNDGQEASDMGLLAAQKILKKCGVSESKIEALVVVTQNGDYSGLPHTSAVIHGKLGLSSKVSTFDISLGCSGYVYALSILKSHMKELGYKYALLITSDPYSKILNKDDKNTSLLFGDAATATLLSSEQGVLSIGKPTLETDGANGDALVKKAELSMNGRAVFNFAATKVPLQISEHLQRNKHAIQDVDLILLHQGSKAVVDVIRRKLGETEEKVPLSLEATGNTVSSSIPLMLEKHIENSSINTILISGFGVGLSWATNILQRINND